MRIPIAIALLSLPLALAGCSHPQPFVYGPPPPGFSGIAQRGYRDGVNAAHRDIATGRAPDMHSHRRFRNPPVAPAAFEDYRRGFHEGYQSMFRVGPPPPPGPGY